MPWQKGQSGNPNGKRTGTRDKITEAFLRDIEEDWRANGKAAIVAAREKDPNSYLKVVSSLLPKQVELEAEVINYVVRAPEPVATTEEWEQEACKVVN